MYFVVKSALKMVPATKYSAETQCANGFRESMGRRELHTMVSKFACSVYTVCVLSFHI